MLRRRKPDDEPEWRVRLASARQLLRDHGDGDLDGRLDTIERALAQAVDDRERVHTTIAQLDPDRVGRELKDALRRQQTGAAAADDSHIHALRRRYETVHALQDRAEELDRRIEATLVDVETLAARSVDLTLGTGGGGMPLALERLHADLAALEAAHRELDALHPGRS